ncbi:hypothetical protein [Paenibacillus sp. FSL L8-0494]|uniref:hypothetical protein n=1 Tax=Paenibacillus sp. FSL L8-0494 TaxID=2975352 RepID=UPI0030FBC3C0
MLFNVIIGWILSWTIGSYYFRKDLSVIILNGPLASVIAFVFNEVGYHWRWWSVTPAKGSLSYGGSDRKIKIPPKLWRDFEGRFLTMVT